jgi:AcrR family transcriptional regulator
MRPRARRTQRVETAQLQAQDSDPTRTRILAATMRCFLQRGIAKTNLQDVARTAEVSRSTVYRYFSSRQALFDAAIEQNVRRYYAEGTAAMRLVPTLARQIGAFSEVLARNVMENRKNYLFNDDREVLALLATDRDGGLRRMTTFLGPYIRQAKARGEVACDVEEHEASELLARMVMTLTAMPTSVTFDIHQPSTVRLFFENYAVDGLTERKF